LLTGSPSSAEGQAKAVYNTQKVQIAEPHSEQVRSSGKDSKCMTGTSNRSKQAVARKKVVVEEWWAENVQRSTGHRQLLQSVPYLGPRSILSCGGELARGRKRVETFFVVENV